MKVLQRPLDHVTWQTDIRLLHSQSLLLLGTGARIQYHVPNDQTKRIWLWTPELYWSNLFVFDKICLSLKKRNSCEFGKKGKKKIPGECYQHTGLISSHTRNRTFRISSGISYKAGHTVPAPQPCPMVFGQNRRCSKEHVEVVIQLKKQKQKKKKPASTWMIASTTQSLSQHFAVAVIHSHLGLPSWLVLTRLPVRRGRSSRWWCKTGRGDVTGISESLRQQESALTQLGLPDHNSHEPTDLRKPLLLL